MHWPALRPPWIHILRALACARLQHLLELIDRGVLGNFAFIEVDAVAVLDGRHEFHAIKRAEVQIILELRCRIQRGCRTPGYTRYQICESALLHLKTVAAALSLRLGPCLNEVGAWLLS